MRRFFKSLFYRLTPTVLMSTLAITATAEPQHGIAMYGKPALPADYQSLPYANPDAPLGGTIISGETGGFDSLNPLILKANPLGSCDS